MDREMGVKQIYTKFEPTKMSANGVALTEYRYKTGVGKL